jgi:hypothetical protein
MKIRTLIVTILGVLVVSIASPAQNAGMPEQEPKEPVFQQSDSPTPAQPKPLLVAQTPSPSTSRPEASMSRRRTIEPMATPPRVRPTPPSMSPKELRIIDLRYTNADELANLIGNVFGIEVHPDTRSNRLIINATEEQMRGILRLIDEMDVVNSEESTPRDVQNLVYRIYMFEIASGDEGMKPFSMILQVPSEASTTELCDGPRDDELQINGFCLSDERDRDGKAEILIHGKTASSADLKRMVIDEIPESRIKELKWDDAETFTNEIAAAQYMQLPEQMQKHIRKFLGNDIRTVGYWFGNLSVPGQVQAPIGPWTLRLQLDTESDRMLQLEVFVIVPDEMSSFNKRLGRERNNDILSNTIRAKIGKPIIIGYNRESYGTRKMGAMVIVPEADPVQSDAAPSNPNRR